MPDHLPTAADHLPSAIEAERAAICGQCNDERTDLIAEMGVLAPEAEELNTLQAWAENSFPTLSPHNHVAVAVQMFQAEEREFDPAYDVTTEDPELIESDIRLYMDQMASQARNANIGAEIETGVPAKIPAVAGAESRLLTEERDLEDAQTELNTQHSNLVTDRATEQKIDGLEKAKTAELRQLQLTFNQLRADGMGTSEALRQVIAQAENPETRQHLNALLGRIALLQTALPNKPNVVDRLLNTAGLNLAATTVVGSFADFLTAAEADQDLTDMDRATLRQIITREERYARTGTQVQTELSQTKTDDNGQIVPAHPEDKPYQFRDHVAGFTQPDGSQKLRATANHGEHVTLDITGWSGADIGRASELLQLWTMTENEGQTGYLTSLTKLNWAATTRIDPISLQHASQVVSALLGHGEGHDGDIFDGRDAIGLIRWQAQLTNQNGGTIRGNRDAEQTSDALVGLGIHDKNGNLDIDALRAFGDYSRDQWNTVPDYDAVQAHLSEQHSDRMQKFA